MILIKIVTISNYCYRPSETQNESSLLPASPSLVASWGCNSYRVFASGTNPIFMATLDASQFLIRIHFDYQLIVGTSGRWPVQPWSKQGSENECTFWILLESMVPGCIPRLQGDELGSAEGYS